MKQEKPSYEDLVNECNRLIKEIKDCTKAERLRMESEANLYSLINNQDESIWSVDQNYNYLIFNDKFKGDYFKHFQIDLKKGMNSLDILTPELRAFWEPKYSEVLRGKRLTFEFQNQAGTEMEYFEVALNPVVTEGLITGVSALSRNVTEKKKAQQLNLENQANMFAILENTTESVWAINPSYEILYTNHVFKTEFEAAFGVVLEPGVNLLKSLPEPLQPLWKSRYDRALSNERFSFVDEIDLVERVIYIEVFMHPIIVDNKVVGASFFGSDITKRKVSEQTLKDNETRLRELNLTKDKFFSIIAHDLKSPFNSILGFSDILLEQVAQKDLEGVEKSTEIIQKSAHHAVDLLTNLLEWSQSQSGRIEFNPEYLELHVLVDKVIKGMGSLARQKSIQITNHVSPNTPIFADRYMLSSILRNLVSNALKFTKSKGEIDIKAHIEDEKLSIIVCDNGVGIPKKDLPKLFRIDMNHSTIGTMDEQGTGLGLILCKEFVEKHGGTIRVESQARKGSCFTVEIPLKID